MIGKYKFDVGTIVLYNNSVGKIIKRIKYRSSDRNLYVVRVNTTDFIMDENGVQKVSKLKYELLK